MIDVAKLARGRPTVLLMAMTVIVFSVSFLLMPKRLSGLEMYTTSLFAVFFGLSTDLFLDVKYHLYGYFDVGVDGLAYVFIVFIYVTVNLLVFKRIPDASSDLGAGRLYRRMVALFSFV